ncbi:META domain-containing protein [Niabella drilacis]|uniref:Heat shock protein HslJ n=1 Tax=Niabella drilacis (strain DSM 25811 / CCM 8410 / CCUG 62505 / LMG 26954 / E90) TaxID=1285928 RepID=A0A1G6J1Q1_NIADE|nr:META domain-containing protein [Niabella drilacis]SDC12708.1 Heat shock protein HslJ [Niabella drilacis]
MFCAALFGMIIFGACKTYKQSRSVSETTTPANTGSITGKKWKLIELAGKPVSDKVNDKEPFVLLQESDHRFSASGGCNGLGGSFELKGNGRISFRPGPSTMMACENMEIEQGLRKALESADSYTLKGNELSLNKARMAPLAHFRFVAAGDTILNGTWELDYISGPGIAFEGLYRGKRPTITFNLPQTAAAGNSSCNNYRVAFMMDGNSIRFKDPASTKMACEGTGEATFFNTLKTVTKYDVVGNTLHLIMGDIAVMRFQRK